MTPMCSCGAERDHRHILFCLFHSFTNRLGYLSGLTETDTHLPSLIADHNNGAEAKAAPAFDNFGYAVDMNNLVN